MKSLIRQQVEWVYKGIESTNKSFPYVAEYFERKMLAEIGYRFDGNDLSDLDVQAFGEISRKLNKLKSSRR